MTPTRATMRGIPGDAARRRGLRRIFIPMVTFAITFGIGIGALLGSAGLFPWWLGVTFLVLTLLGLRIYSREQPDLVYGYFKGARGEEMTASELARLPCEWTVFNGVMLPDKCDVDHIAVGPQGVFVIETKHWRGSISVQNGEILAEGRVIRKSPIIQLRHLLARLTAAIPLNPESVHGVLCFAGHQFAEGAVKSDELTVCSHIGLPETLTAGPAVLDAAARNRIVSQLGALTITEGL